MAGRTYKTEAVVLRSMRFGEADRVLHLYTLDRGRIGAVAKGVRKTTSRFGARLEPLSHVELVLHQGSGELQTVTGVQLVRAHHESREDYYRLSVGLIGAEAMLRLFSEQEANERAFGARHALPRPPRRAAAHRGPAGARPARALLPAEAALALRLSAAPDELRGVRRGRRDARRLLAARRRRRLRRLRGAGRGAPLSADGIRGIEALLAQPLADATALGLGERASRDALTVITASYEYHGGFRLRTLSA